MYKDPSHKKRNEVKVRLNDSTNELLEFFAQRDGMQPAVWARAAVTERMMMELKKQRLSNKDHEWMRLAIEEYLADKGHDLLSRERQVS